jgi:hypothetical protein
MRCSPTVAANRTDRQPLLGGHVRPALLEHRLRLPEALPAAPRASARARRRDRLLGALGRWRCRWNAHSRRIAVVRLVVGIGRRASRCRLSPGAWSSLRCWVGRVGRAVARRRGTIAWRRACTR